MKKIITLLMLTICFCTNATHQLTYIVYFETEYIQGPWSRLDLLVESDYKYLEAQSFEDSFGSIKADMVNKMISRLKDDKPDIYNWTYELSIEGDTVILTPNGQIKEIETIKNEITATLTHNNFSAVIFYFGEKKEVLTIDDLSLPYFDLVTKQQNKSEAKIQEVTIDTIYNIDTVQSQKVNIKPCEDKEQEDNLLSIWLIISGILNIGLIGFLMMKNKKS